MFRGTCIHGRLCFITFMNCPEFKAKRMLACKVRVCLHNSTFSEVLDSQCYGSESMGLGMYSLL